MDKKQLFEDFFKPLVAIYGYPTRLKTDEEKKSFASEYLDDLFLYKNVDWHKIKVYLKTNCSYFPKIPEIRNAIATFSSVTDPKQVYKKRMEAERARRTLRRSVREDIYRANTETCEKIIHNGWGLQFACSISDMFESSFNSGQYDLLAKDANARVHYSPPSCQGKDPLYYYSMMPVNDAGLKAMAEHPVQFIESVRS